jgi:uncharacterized protein YlxW (UPF0749 family)
MKQILSLARWIAYILLLVTDITITVLSMISIGHNPVEKTGLGIIGAVIVILGTYLFLTGIRSKSWERLIRLGSWILSVVLIVAINWAFTSTMLRTQTANLKDTQSEQSFDEQVRQKSIVTTQSEIDALTKKLSTVSIWMEKDRKAIASDLQTAKESLKELTSIKRVEVNQVVSMDVFGKMAAFGISAETMSSFWWLLAFLVLQLFAVLTAPKPEEDAPVKKKRRRRKPKPAAELKPEPAKEPELFEWDELQ